MCERKLIKLDASFSSFGLFTITEAGREALKESDHANQTDQG